MERQIAYGKQRRVPWGISESAFARVRRQFRLSLSIVRRARAWGSSAGLGKDLVISPYSTALALAVKPAEAVANFRVLANEGAEGPWGFYDAVDYTPDRVPEGERRVVVFCYMAHHQGMTMVALANCLLDHRVQRRFQRQPLIRSTDLLLQERIPLAVLQFQPQDDAVAAVPPLPVTAGPGQPPDFHAGHRDAARPSALERPVPRDADQRRRRLQQLPRPGDHALACRRDARRLGTIHLPARPRRRTASGRPAISRRASPADTYEVTYLGRQGRVPSPRRKPRNASGSHDLARMQRRSAAGHDHQSRPSAGNRSSSPAMPKSCSQRAGGDAAHPAFSKLFVETEFVPECHALLARRRPRDATSAPAWAVHVLAAPPSGARTPAI